MEILYVLNTEHVLFPHSSVRGHLGDWLLSLTTVNNAAVSVRVQTPLQVRIFSSLGCIPQSGIAALYGEFLRNCQTRFLSGCIILLSHLIHDFSVKCED